jgi:predicted esterase
MRTSRTSRRTLHPAGHAPGHAPDHRWLTLGLGALGVGAASTAAFFLLRREETPATQVPGTAGPATASLGPTLAIPTAPTMVKSLDAQLGQVISKPTETPAASPAPAPVTLASPVATVPKLSVLVTGTLPSGSGLFRSRLTIAGTDRDMAIYLPTRRTPASAPASAPTPAKPPLVLFFHGTGGAGQQILEDSGAIALAEAAGAVLIAPDARWMPSGDWDHATEEGYWQTWPSTEIATNPDLALVSVLLALAAQAYGTDPDRVYLVGHSSGGFFALLAAVTLREFIAAFALSSAGLVHCARTLDCAFQGRGTSCEALAAQGGHCTCSGAAKPVEIPAGPGAKPPALLLHGTADPLVSVDYTCTLSRRFAEVAWPAEVRLRDGDGHEMPEGFMQIAWPFLETKRRGGAR